MGPRMDYERHILSLVSTDLLRMRALSAVQSLGLPDWLIAAGFVRNKIWDWMFDTVTPLTDIDVIYYDVIDVSPERDRWLELQLYAREPKLPWSVKNQARMHLKNGDSPYAHTLDAMSHWPERQTCIGVNILTDRTLQLRHCFDLEDQFSGVINRNPKRSSELFHSRIRAKDWLNTWPQLKIAIL